MSVFNRPPLLYIQIFTPVHIVELCLKNIQMLESCSLVKMDDGFTLQHTGQSPNKALFIITEVFYLQKWAG